MVAALYVETNGVYYGLPDVDPWDEARDARKYDGPWPVVAHPPCTSWSILGQCRPEIVRGDDGGTFAAALDAVRRFGGVIEHPANSHAWRAFDLPYPSRFGWTQSLTDDGYATEVDQGSYGFPITKRTWLYCAGIDPPALTWLASRRPSYRAKRVGGGIAGSSRGALRSRTPNAFRDVLLDMARSIAREGLGREPEPDRPDQAGALVREVATDTPQTDEGGTEGTAGKPLAHPSTQG